MTKHGSKSCNPAFNNNDLLVSNHVRDYLLVALKSP